MQRLSVGWTFIFVLVLTTSSWADRRGESVCGESPNQAIAVTWQSSTGNWWAHGPTQNLSMADNETEGEALRYVVPTCELVGWDECRRWGTGRERDRREEAYLENLTPTCYAAYRIRDMFGARSEEAGDRRVRVYVLGYELDKRGLRRAIQYALTQRRLFGRNQLTRAGVGLVSHPHPPHSLVLSP